MSIGVLLVNYKCDIWDDLSKNLNNSWILIFFVLFILLKEWITKVSAYCGD